MDKTRAGQVLAQYNNLFKENDQLYHAAAKAFGLSDCAFWILYSLCESDKPLTQSDICNLIYQPKQTVNSALKKLEKDGLIALEEMSDRRSKQLRLTQKGAKTAAQTAEQVLAAERSAFLGLSMDEQDEFLLLFRKYTDLLKKSMSALTL